MTDLEKDSRSYPGYSLSLPREVIREAESQQLLQSLLPLETGLFEQAAGHGILRRGLDEYILIYCTAGRGNLELQDRRHTVVPGTVLICPPGVPHRYWADPLSPWTIYWLHFKGRAVPAIVEALEISLTAPCRQLGVKEELIRDFLELNRRLRQGHGLPHLYRASAALHELLSRMVINAGYAAAWEEGGLHLETVLDGMQRGLGRNLNLEDLAREAGLSKYHFSRKFRQALGESPMAYYNQLKVRRACELLDMTSMSIKEISSSLAFSTPYYFSSVFKRAIGLSPTTYRRERLR